MSLNNLKYKLRIIKSKRKSIALQIQSSDEVIVRAPRHMGMADIEKFIDKHKSWIDKISF